MALAKMGLISELSSFSSLLRLVQAHNKLGGGNGGSRNYQLATQDYCVQLRELYRQSVRERRRASAKLRRARKEASALSDKIFKLTLAQDGELLGITLERTSLPLAELADKVQLLRVQEDGEENGVAGEQPAPLVQLTHGTVSMVSGSQIRIKFQEPLRGKRRRQTQQQTPIEVQPVSSQVQEEGGDDVDAAAATASSAEAEKVVGDDESTPTQEEQDDKSEEPEMIHFKIKFDLSGDAAEEDQEDNDHDDKDGAMQLIEETLYKFAKLKCNQSLHRNLLGLYDERSDHLMINERARVLTSLGVGGATLGGASGRLPKLNAQQRAAVEQALKRRLTLIEGPAGSGKTLVAALIAANACRIRQNRVLVCSPLQSTVDRLTELLLDLVGDGLHVIKLPENPSAPTRRANPRQRRPRRGQRATTTANGVSVQKGGAADSRSNLLIDYNDDKLTQSDFLEQSSSEAADRCHLDKLVDDELYLQAYARSKDTLGIRSHEQLHEHAYRMVTNCSHIKRREMESKLISRANVVCCTLVQAGSYLLKGAEFELLILDDQHVTSELDSLIAIMAPKGVKQLTLLSDTRRRIRLARSRLSEQKTSQQQQQVASATTSNSKQVRTGSRNSSNSNSSLRRNKRTKELPRSARMSPVTSESNSSENSSDADTSNGGATAAKSKCLPRLSLEPGNLFERLLSLGLPTVDMRVQYRCHATLANFFNYHFYAGRLKNDRKTNDKLSAEIDTSLMLTEQNFSWLPNRKYLTALFEVRREEKKKDLNHLETRLTEILNRLLIDENIQESRIGIIYNRHSLLRKALKRLHSSSSGDSPTRDLKMTTIDGFIGQERDFVILVAGSPDEDEDAENLDLLSDADAKSYLGLTSEITCDFRLQDAALNWAITRAKLGLFLVADATTTDEELKVSAGSDTSQLKANGNADTKEEEEEEIKIEGDANSEDKVRRRRDCGSWRELVKYYQDNELAVCNQ